MPQEKKEPTLTITKHGTRVDWAPDSIKSSLAGDHIVMTLPLTEDIETKFLEVLHASGELVPWVTLDLVPDPQYAPEKPPAPTEVEDFKAFVDTQREAPTPTEAAEIDQRALPSHIIAAHVAEHAAKENREPSGEDLLQALVMFLDYQRQQMDVRRPPGESGDIEWHVRVALANAGVSPERALVSAVEVVAHYQCDLYGQNAKIRKRLAEVERQLLDRDETLARVMQAREQDRTDMLGMVKRIEACLADLGQAPLEVGKGLREEIDSVQFQTEAGGS